MTKVLLIGLMCALGGCDRGSASTLVPESTSSSELELRGLMPADAVLVGVAVAPDGKRYVLDQRSGLYEVGSQGARLVLNTTGLGNVELTDVVALDSTRFALTAENDGFMYDTQSQELVSYFCYLPAVPTPPEGSGGSASTGGSSGTAEPPEVTLPVSISQQLQLDGIAVKQRTESVAYSAETRQLFAQPRTIRLDDGSVAGSELFTFEQGGGEPIRVQALLDASFVAGGMATLPSDRLLLGTGRDIFQITWDGDLRHLLEVDGVTDISGMARAPSGALWLLDGPAQRLVKVDTAL